MAIPWAEVRLVGDESVEVKVVQAPGWGTWTWTRTCRHSQFGFDLLAGSTFFSLISKAGQRDIVAEIGT